MDNKSQIESIRADRLLVQEINGKLESGQGMYKAWRWNVPSDAVRRALVGPPVETGLDAMPMKEAIIVEFGGPSLLIRNDTFDLSQSDVWKNTLYPMKSKIEAAIRPVGRLDLHPGSLLCLLHDKLLV